MSPGKENGELQKRLLAIFRVEAAEHLKVLSTQLLALERSSGEGEQAAVIETLFREAHSLKGAARAVNLYAVESACKTLESAFAARKAQPAEAIAPSWFETVYRAVDALEALLASKDREPQEEPEDRLGLLASVEDEPRAEAIRGPHLEPAASTARRTLPQTGDSVRIATARLAALQVQAEELTAFKSGAVHVVGELRALGGEVALWRKAWDRTARDARAVRRIREKRDDATHPRWMPIDKLLDAVERDEAAARSFGERLAAIEYIAERERRRLSIIVDNLQGNMRRALMQPFASLLELIPKLVGDLARDSGKKVDLRIEGASIEIDRGILEQMKDPLIHLVRNAVDHGIETPEARRIAGKPLPARIAITVVPKEGNRIELVIADDGVGVDLDKVAAAAAKLGLVGADTAPQASREAALTLMFESGVSTRQIVTDLSGQGLGLAIVREKVEALGGSIAAELPAAGGTLFRIVLPTVLATFRGVLVAAGGRDRRQFVLPSRSVERVLRIEAAGVKTLEGRPAVEIGGQAVSLVRLSDVLGLPAGDEDGKYLQLAVVEGAGRRIAFAVDAILDDLEVLVKGLGPQLRRVPNIAGATVLGTGDVVPILNVADLLKSALRIPSRAAQAAADSAQRLKSLLVVEDSVTARALLRGLLEAAGYRVDTAVDGVAALAALRSGSFDLVISDVEMPRMDGFELTARIRSDPRLAGLPVVLVTALDSREDKERGIDVGANAYIVKSGFDQSNLFAVIRRLL